ncbi:hypothetical protein VPNG_05494 [Cytospora leucostoma]|uniref:MICOS complex subunit MIC12 n=1 Tax=Cytospora leucostoma TaxID=1230097 RepID=A0A423XBJ3_9PEZI|nr:hypothetical protein VPNG_05494 [Cytospora leucostoma]
MGFTTGFVTPYPPLQYWYKKLIIPKTGGVTLVLGISYLTLQSHRRTRERQAETLRANAYVLNSLSYVPATAPPPKTIAEEIALLEQQQELLARAERQQSRGARGAADSFLERAKDKWNSEVEGAVRWATTKDWTAAREDAEDTAARVWARATGGEQPAQTAERAGGVVAERAAAAAGAARGAAEQASARTGEVAHERAAEAKEAATSIWERGFRKGKEVAGKAKEAVERAEQIVQDKALEIKGAEADSSVERVLQQRYEGKDGVFSKSVEELLEERYKPMVEQDNSILRGL